MSDRDQVALARMQDPAWVRILRGAKLGHEIHLHEPDAREQLRELYTAPRRDWVRMNMIGSLNGKVTGPDGTSDTLSNRADRRILGIIRELSEVIVVGAQTLRKERHLPTAPAYLCVVTGSGDLRGHRIDPESAAASVLVCCPPDAEARARDTMPGAEIITMQPQGQKLSLDHVLTALRERSLRQIVVEGGNRLISQFLDERRLDEICITQAPVFAPDSSPSLPGSGAGEQFRRTLMLEDEVGFLYQRLLRGTDS